MSPISGVSLVACFDSPVIWRNPACWPRFTSYRVVVLLRVLSLFVALLALTACTGPCEELAEITCGNAGDESESCVWIEERASQATNHDKRACKVALELVANLEKAK
ncbi:MAG: hypothetical protein VYE15_04950 [Myxococcota bacterium]|nr:hypothetical protein [Myxococcota bacterium]